MYKIDVSPVPTTATTPQQLARIAGFIWGIADDVLRDLYVRGKYRDVILPMTVFWDRDPDQAAIFAVAQAVALSGFVPVNG
jgi:hypothetical protein